MMISRIPFRGKSNAAFLGFKGAARTSAFGRFGNTLRYVRAGSRFCRANGPSCSEMARVLSVSADSRGIQHIRYAVVADEMKWQFVGQPKVLPLSSFSETYENAIGAR